MVKIQVLIAKDDPLALTINSSLGQITLVMTTQNLRRQATCVLIVLPVTALLCAGEPPTLSGLFKHCYLCVVWRLSSLLRVMAAHLSFCV